MVVSVVIFKLDESDVRHIEVSVWSISSGACVENCSCHRLQKAWRKNLQTFQHTLREMYISSGGGGGSVGELAPQRLPWTAATGQITATGDWMRKTSSAFVQSPSSTFYF